MSPTDSSDPASRAALSSRRAEVWSEYWKSGALHSCAGSFAGNYAGAIANFWRRVFAALPPAARVLDLCCGNAPLSRLLLEERALPGEHGHIDAVDAAAVAPAWIAALPPPDRARIDVHAGVDARHLPFDPERYDLCMSQYGVEYAGLEAMHEVRRVLRPGANFAAVLHHTDALPVRIAREELAHLAWLSQAEGLLALARDLVEPMARAATPAGQASLRGDVRASARRAELNARLAELERRLQSSTFPDVLHETRVAIAAALQRARAEGTAVGEQALARLNEDLQASTLRQQDLVEYALDERALQDLIAAVGDPAPEVGVLTFESGEVAGWAVQARRR